MVDERTALVVVDSLHGDVDDADDLADELRRELRETGFDAGWRDQGDAPAGAKGGALAWAQLAVSFSGGLPALVAAIRGFTQRDETRRVAITLDNDTIELTAQASPEQKELVETWLVRHSVTSTEA